jgi:hypothetical protein
VVLVVVVIAIAQEERNTPSAHICSEGGVVLGSVVVAQKSRTPLPLWSDGGVVIMVGAQNRNKNPSACIWSKRGYGWL